MPELPVFERSDNLRIDVKNIEESKALGFGWWKGQIVQKGLAIRPAVTINGHKCLSGFVISKWLKPAYKDTDQGKSRREFLELLGMNEDDFNELNNVWANDAVDGIYFQFTEKFTANKSSLALAYSKILEYAPTIEKIEIDYENVYYREIDYPTEPERIAVKENAKSPSTRVPYDSVIGYEDEGDKIHTISTMKLYDGIGTDITPALDGEGEYPLWFEALKALMLMDGDRISTFTSLTKASERLYQVNVGTLTNPVYENWYAVTSRVTYDGLLASQLHEGFGDQLVDAGEKVRPYSLGLRGRRSSPEVWDNNYASYFWRYAEVEFVGEPDEKIGYLTVEGERSAFSRKFFETVDNYYLYPKIDAIRQATPLELQFLFANFINIQVTTKKKKWYSGFVSVIGTIFSWVAEIGAGVFDFLMYIPVVGHFIELQLWLVAKLVGTSYQNVEDFARENTGKVILAVATLGASAGLDQAIGTAIELAVATTVEMLVAVGLHYLAVGIMVAYWGVVALIANAGFALTQATGLPTSVEGLIDQIVSAFYEMGVAMNAQVADAIETIKETITEEDKEITSFKDDQSEIDEMYEGMFMPLDKLDADYDVFANGGLFDMQKDIEGG